jgi:hypothetical protein
VTWAAERRNARQCTRFVLIRKSVLGILSRLCSSFVSCQAESREPFLNPRIVAAKTPSAWRAPMDRMTFYAAGALMAWVIVGAAAIF